MDFSNPPADRQSVPGSGILLSSMESAQHFKHPIQISRAIPIALSCTETTHYVFFSTAETWTTG